MRILLLRDAFTSSSPSGAMTFLSQLARQAAGAGHELLELVSHPTASGKSLDAFRRRMRRRLDGKVADFDPQAIHVQGFGVLGHLALETGAPYLVASWGDELLDCQNDAHMHDFAQQTAENAGQIVFDSPTTRQRALAAFGEAALGNRAICLTDMGWPGAETESEIGSNQPSLDWLWSVYRELVTRRRGRLDDLGS